MLSIPNDYRREFTLPFSDAVNAVVLAANTAELIPIPSGAKFVLLTGTVNFYADPTTTATVPADTTDGSASELALSTVPVLRSLVGVNATGLSVISASICIVTAAFYS